MVPVQFIVSASSNDLPPDQLQSETALALSCTVEVSISLPKKCDAINPPTTTIATTPASHFRSERSQKNSAHATRNARPAIII